MSNPIKAWILTTPTLRSGVETVRASTLRNTRKLYLKALNTSDALVRAGPKACDDAITTGHIKLDRVRRMHHNRTILGILYTHTARGAFRAQGKDRVAAGLDDAISRRYSENISQKDDLYRLVNSSADACVREQT